MTTEVTKTPSPLADALIAYAPATMPTEETKREYVDLVKKQLIAGKGTSPSDTELVYFLQVCQSSGLNPLTRQIYAIYRGGKMTIQSGIDGLRAIAERTGKYAGSDAGMFEYDEHGQLARVTVVVRKIVSGQVFEVSASARWSEYAVPSNPMWKKMPETMLEKCAEAKALRKAFPNIGQVYTDEEMQQADRVPVVAEADVVKPDTKVIEAEAAKLVAEAMAEKEAGSEDGKE